MKRTSAGAALDRLIAAVARRENTTGDPITLISAQAELRAAMEQARAALSTTPEAAKDATGRTPKDYAIERAGYMAKAGEQLMEAINEQTDLLIRREESDDVDDSAIQAAGVAVFDAMSGLRLQIYEFRKRRDRANTTKRADNVGAAGKGCDA